MRIAGPCSSPKPDTAGLTGFDDPRTPHSERKESKDPHATQRWLRRQKFEKQTKLKPETFEFARYVMVFTA